MESVGQKTAKLPAVKVEVLKKKYAVLAIPAKVCGSAFGPGSSQTCYTIRKRYATFQRKSLNIFEKLKNHFVSWAQREKMKFSWAIEFYVTLTVLCENADSWYYQNKNLFMNLMCIHSCFGFSYLTRFKIWSDICLMLCCSIVT